jgi:hypothetical protein
MTRPCAHLIHLFDADLQYEDGMQPVVRLHDAGELVGSGTGQVNGPRLQGTMRWSNFEHVFGDHCQLNVAGIIETVDGAQIRFDSKGFAVPPAEGGAWKVASAVRFAASDGRYRWLEAGPAVWEGEFDENAATARYRAYVSEGPNSDDV